MNADTYAYARTPQWNPIGVTQLSASLPCVCVCVWVSRQRWEYTHLWVACTYEAAHTWEPLTIHQNRVNNFSVCVIAVFSSHIPLLAPFFICLGPSCVPCDTSTHHTQASDLIRKARRAEWERKRVNRWSLGRHTKKQKTKNKQQPLRRGIPSNLAQIRLGSCRSMFACTTATTICVTIFLSALRFSARRNFLQSFNVT